MVSSLATAQAIGDLINDLLTRRPPVDEREATSIARFRTELAGRVEPCSQSADTTHVTASAIVVGPRGVVLSQR